MKPAGSGGPAQAESHAHGRPRTGPRRPEEGPAADPPKPPVSGGIPAVPPRPGSPLRGRRSASASAARTRARIPAAGPGPCNGPGRRQRAAAPHAPRRSPSRGPRVFHRTSFTAPGRGHRRPRRLRRPRRPRRWSAGRGRAVRRPRPGDRTGTSAPTPTTKTTVGRPRRGRTGRSRPGPVPPGRPRTGPVVGRRPDGEPAASELPGEVGQANGRLVGCATARLHLRLLASSCIENVADSKPAARGDRTMCVAM